MKKNIKLTILFFIVSFSNYSQIYKDLDNDKVKDTIYLDSVDYKIVCKLSTKNFKAIFSKSDLTDTPNSGIHETKSGFEFYVNYMRSGFAHQFKYDLKTQKIRLIVMSRYELGPASNDGSGESSVNLLTNKYIGEWNHFNDEKEELIKMPTIKAKMIFPKLYLEDYDGAYQSVYQEKCSELYYTYKRKM